MKKRLRKKKHKGEFQEFGFEIELEWKPDCTQTDLLFDEFIELMEKEKLLFGGGLSRGFITAQKGSVTDVNKTVIEDWIISKNDAIVSFKLQKKDAWH